LLALLLILTFRPQLKDIIPRVTEFEIFGLKGKIQNQLNQSAQQAKLDGLSEAPSPGELERAVRVEAITGKTGLSIVRQEVGELAAEYERVRASMPPGEARTRALEVVVAKMRTIGRAAYPLRYELSHSTSPGCRLQAIASLQVLPDYDLLEWLVDCIRAERPFVGYHALVALNSAAADERALTYLSTLEAALTRVQEIVAKVVRDGDRERAFSQFEAQLNRLQDSVARASP
jgi:hypothetical protein